MPVSLSVRDVQKALSDLGYYDGEIHRCPDTTDPNFRTDLKLFQRDYGLEADGLYGPKSDTILAKLATQIYKAREAGILPAEASLRRWRLTYYYISDQTLHKGPKTVPVKNPKGEVIATVEATFFSQMALEGTGRLRDGRLLNVASEPDYLPCDPNLLTPCFDLAKRNKWLPDRPGYAGILVDKDCTKATKARTFSVRNVGPTGWPSMKVGIPLDPWRTLASDIGASAIKRSEPRLKGKGGTCPAGSNVFILESQGWKLPDGDVHDGSWLANDCGGGIFGAHFDLFVGYPSLAKLNTVPERGHIWYPGIEKRVPFDYSYGL